MTTETTAPTMPFGRYKGAPLADIETAYLRWVLTLGIGKFLRQEIRRVLVRRELAEQREQQIRDAEEARRSRGQWPHNWPRPSCWPTRTHTAEED